MNVEINKCNLSGKLKINSSKSIAHRAIISALVTKTESIIKNINMCDDIENTIYIANKIANIETKNDEIIIKPPININVKEIEIEESMSTFNFFLPFLSYYSKSEITFKLGKRLIERIGNEYEKLYSLKKDCYFIKNGNEIKVKGFPLEKEMLVSNKITSQCATGILFLMASTNDQYKLTIDSNNSISYIDETIDVLKDFGTTIYRENKNIFVMHNQTKNKTEYIVPGDGSDYLFKTAISELYSDVEIEKYDYLENDPDYALTNKIKFNNFKFKNRIDLSNNPDAIFGLILFALKNKEEITFTGVERLSKKESNRIESTKNILNLFGFKTFSTKESLTINMNETGNEAIVDSFNDHRVAQLATILCCIYGGKINNIECISKSSPSFLNDLEEVGMKITKEPIILKQKLENKETEIVFSEDTTKINIEKNKKYAIITDKNIYKIYEKEIKKLFPNGHIYITTEVGEKIKTLETYNNVCEFLLKKSIAKDDCLVAFGGGTITDLVGYVAATYKRGIKNMISIPTSLIGMVDASIGFKNGINLDNIKNAIGEFYAPNQIIINTNYLKTLPESETKSGMAEIIKIFALRSEKYLNKVFVESIDKNLSKWILEAIKLKLEFVEQDPYDENIRHALNFGHTYGHVFEMQQNISHGEAIAKGMRVISNSKELDNVLNKYKFYSATDEQIKEAKKFIKNDKKVENNKLKMVRVDEIGKYEFVEEEL